MEDFIPIPLQSGGFVYAVQLEAPLQVPVKLVLVYNDVHTNLQMNYTSPESYFNSKSIKHISDRDEVPFDRFRVKVALMYNSDTMGPFFQHDNNYGELLKLWVNDL